MKRTTLKQRIGLVLRKYREAQGISQEAFALKAGMHRTYYSTIERGLKDLRIETLARICKALKVKMSVVLREAEE